MLLWITVFPVPCHLTFICSNGLFAHSVQFTENEGQPPQIMIKMVMIFTDNKIDNESETALTGTLTL